MRQSLPFKIYRALSTRRSSVPRLVRGALLFWFTRLLRLLLPASPGIELGRNVRLQWPSCLLAEAPDARIQVSDDAIIYENAKIEAYGTGQIRIGASSVIGDNRIYCRGRIDIGARVVTSWNVFLQDFDPHPIDPDLRREQVLALTSSFYPRFERSAQSPMPPPDFDFSIEPITIGDDVWIGAGVTILKGARIGDGSIVAAGAVVTRGEYPPRSVLAGNPARVVKTV
jgi:acetyltransferase-like isoleucine patch superfamily enzyme